MGVAVRGRWDRDEAGPEGHGHHNHPRSTKQTLAAPYDDDLPPDPPGRSVRSMALRYLARRALQQRRALVPRVALPSAGSRPVCTSGGSSPPPPPPPQGVLINESKAAAAAAASKGNKEPELLHTDSSKLTDNAQMCQKLDAIIEGLKEYARYQQEQANHDWCLMMGSAVAAGVGLAFLHIAYDIRKEIEITLAEEVVDSMMKIVLQRLLWNWQLMLEDSSKDGEDKQDQDI